ncbi:kinase domain-containing protein, partial [Microthyrium microscopicum]
MDSSTNNSDSFQPIYNLITEVETLEQYRKGGYHPVHLGDVFHDRYQVFHKIGFGSYSTVWLAYDTKDCRNVALKVTGADFMENDPEAELLQTLTDGDDTHTGKRYVNTLLDKFFVDGPNGRHLCLVMDVAAMSVMGARSTEGFEMTTARVMMAQAILALSYVHSCGIVHADLTSSNMLIQYPDIATMTKDEVYKRIGNPEVIPITRIDGQPLGPESPRYAVEPRCFLLPATKLLQNIEITISDFGVGFKESEPQELLTGACSIPPESVLICQKGPVGRPADIWTLACTLFNIVQPEDLFVHWSPEPDDLMIGWITAIGKPPQEVWDAWEGKSEHFNEDGSYKDSEIEDMVKSVEQRLRGIYGPEGDGGDFGNGSFPSVDNRSDFSEEEWQALIALLMSMLKWDPSDRPTAEDLLKSKWMVEFGYPALE